MEEYFEKSGTRAEIIEEIMRKCRLDKEGSERCFDFLEDNPEIISGDELLQCNDTGEYTEDGVAGFVSKEMEMYVSVKKTTLFALALFLGFEVPIAGIAFDIAGFMGVYDVKGGFAKVKEDGGELCIMMELAKNRRRGADKNLLRRFKGECCNNHLACKFNHNGYCSCKEDKVEQICEKFEEMGMVRKRGSKYFYIM